MFFQWQRKKKKINPYYARVQKHKEPWEDTPAAHPRANVPPERLGASPVGQREKTATYIKLGAIGQWDRSWTFINVGVLRFQIIANNWPLSIDCQH